MAAHDEVLTRLKQICRRGSSLGSSSYAPAGPAGSARDSIRKHLIAGGVIVLVLAFGVGGWAATTQIAGALIAQGSIVVDSNVKKVQHPTGGVVGKLFVQDGDRVKAGQILVQLDDTVTRANLAIVTKGLDELAARKARLEAERDGADTDHLSARPAGARRAIHRSPMRSPTSASCSSCAARRAPARRRSCSSASGSSRTKSSV